jgi:hypothetical protein
MKHHSLSESFLYPINDQVCASKTLEEAQTVILGCLRQQKGSRDVYHMIHTVEHDITNHTKLLFWYYSNLQAYSGNKVVQPIPR